MKKCTHKIPICQEVYEYVEGIIDLFLQDAKENEQKKY